MCALAALVQGWYRAGAGLVQGWYRCFVEEKQPFCPFLTLFTVNRGWGGGGREHPQAWEAKGGVASRVRGEGGHTRVGGRGCPEFEVEVKPGLGRDHTRVGGGSRVGGVVPHPGWRGGHTRIPRAVAKCVCLG